MQTVHVITTLGQPDTTTVPDLSHIPTALLVFTLLSALAPFASARISKLHWDTWVTGVITALISAILGFAGEWAHAGSDFNWKTAALTSLGAWLVACFTQARVLSGTNLETTLRQAGSGESVSDGQPDPTAGLNIETGEPIPAPAVTGTAVQTPVPDDES